MKPAAMNPEVTAYIEATKPWQAEVCQAVRTTVHSSLSGIEEALQYGKPHFVREGRHVAVLHVATAKVSFLVFDAGALEPVPGVLRSLGSGDRKVVDIREGDDVDLDFLTDLLRRTSGHE